MLVEVLNENELDELEDLIYCHKNSNKLMKNFEAHSMSSEEFLKKCGELKAKNESSY
nr:MAG TPA: hypothetical protein [Bacteriophage sp.]